MSMNILRAELVEAAAVRTKVYYHGASDTHIVQQLDGTEFGSMPIKGCGSFADDAYQDYRSKVYKAVEDMKLGEIGKMTAKIGRIAPECLNMKEVPV